MMKSLTAKVSFLTIMCFVACNNTTDTIRQEVLLQKTETTKRINITDNISAVTKNMRYFTDDNEGYIAIQGMQNGIISIYSYADGSLVKEVKPKEEGPNSIDGALDGFDILNFDTIFVKSYSYDNKLFIMDSCATIRSTIEFETTEDPYVPLSFLWSSLGDGVNYENHSIKIGGYYSDTEEVWKKLNEYDIFCYGFDFTKDAPIHYQLKNPDVNDANILHKNFHIISKRNKIIMSFDLSSVIFVSTDNGEWEKYDLNSKYVVKKFRRPSSSEVYDFCKQIVESPCIESMAYDKYRDVYYRFIYPGIDTTSDDDIMLIQKIFRVFSVMVLDKDFNVIGETLMPEKTYNPNMYFINEDGLWISTNNPENPNFEEDAINFDLFTLK